MWKFYNTSYQSLSRQCSILEQILYNKSLNYPQVQLCKFPERIPSKI